MHRDIADDDMEIYLWFHMMKIQNITSLLFLEYSKKTFLFQMQADVYKYGGANWYV